METPGNAAYASFHEGWDTCYDRSILFLAGVMFTDIVLCLKNYPIYFEFTILVFHNVLARCPGDRIVDLVVCYFTFKVIVEPPKGGASEAMCAPLSEYAFWRR